MKKKRFFFVLGFGGIIGIPILAGLYLYNPLIALIASLFLLILVPLLKSFINNSKFDLFEPINFALLTFFILYVLKPLYYFFYRGMEVRLSSYLFPKDTFTTLLNQSELIAIIGLISLYLGYYLKIFPVRIKSGYISPVYSSKLMIKSIILIMLIISALSTLYFSIKVGGVDYYMANTTSRVIVTSGLTLFIHISVTTLSIAYFLWLIFFSKNMNGFILILILGVVVTYFFFFLSRTPIIFILMTTLIFRYYTIKKFGVIKIITIGIIVLTIAFSQLYFRSGGGLRDNLKRNPVISMFKSNLISDKMFFIILENIPENISYRHGSTLLNSFLFFVPRSIYKEKPIDISTELSMQFFPYMQGGISTTFIGELYLNFGLAGVPIGMFILGIFLRIFLIYFRNHKNDIGVIIVYAASCFWIFDIIYKNLWHFIAGLAWNVIFLWIIIKLLRHKPIGINKKQIFNNE